MNILIVGSGGREHALAWKLRQSPKVEKLFIAPGNAGTSLLGEKVSLDILDHRAVIDFSKQHNIDLVVVGPDDTLASGIVNSVASAGIKIFGPTEEAAEIEWSKTFGVLRRAGIGRGYPGNCKKGVKVDGIAKAGNMDDVVIFQAGTKTLANKTVTNGGRVLGISATGADIPEALHKAYKAVEKIHFDGMQYRRDIA